MIRVYCVVCDLRVNPNFHAKVSKEFRNYPACPDCFDSFDDADAFLEYAVNNYKQLAVDTHGNAVRDNSESELIEIGRAIHFGEHLE